LTKLVFVGGAPGVGKSSVARELLARLRECVWLDGDDLWRMHPFVVNDTATNMVEHNIQSVLLSFIRTGFSVVIFTWVLHDKAIIDRLRQGIGD
jgi:predicted ABC-type ATPase